MNRDASWGRRGCIEPNIEIKREGIMRDIAFSFMLVNILYFQFDLWIGCLFWWAIAFPAILGWVVIKRIDLKFGW